MIQAFRRREWWLLAALVAAAFLLSHPYSGIRHDGILYFGDALARLVPGELHDDPYFYYGSQGRFTLLPYLYAQLIAVFGIGAGTIAGLLAAVALQVTAILVVVAVLAPPPLRAYCALSVVLGWSIYGGLRVFAYGEPFLTARSFAEPVVLLALAALFRQRLAMCVAGLCLALLIHPLIAFGGGVLAATWLALRNPRWLFLGLLAAIALGVLGWWGKSPFDDVFARYDENWYGLVHEANPQAFINLWGIVDLGNVVFASVVLWLAARCVEDRPFRRVATAALITGLLCFALSWVGVDLLRNPFLGKLQIWRALWLMQWFAMFAFPLLAVALWRRGEAGRIAALLLTIGWMASFSVAPPIVAAMALLLERFGGRIALTRTTTRIVGALVVVIALVIAGQYIARTVKLALLLDQPWHLVFRQFLTLNLAIAGIAFLALKVFDRRPWAAAAIALTLLVAGAGLWDQRSPWTRRMESYPVGTTIWPGVVEPTARVYWYRDLIAPWILLGHANYYTMQQGSGAVFSRAMTTELDNRRRVTAILDFQEQLCRMMNSLNEKANSCEPDSAAMESVCTDGKIDYVVLQSGLEGAQPAAQYSTGVFENGYEKKFFLYRCSALKP